MAQRGLRTRAAQVTGQAVQKDSVTRTPARQPPRAAVRIMTMPPAAYGVPSRVAASLQ
jgi:hypothetical protein